MAFFFWLYSNLGAFFVAVFMLYLYLVIYRFTALWRILSQVGKRPDSSPVIARISSVESMLHELGKGCGTELEDSLLIDAIWLEQENCVAVHIRALNAYMNSLILFGFAGTIMGCVNAFNNLFHGMDAGGNMAKVFMGTWDSGLNTALYSSLAAALLGGGLMTLLHSGLIMGRCKRLEALLNDNILAAIKGRRETCANDAEK